MNMKTSYFVNFEDKRQVYGFSPASVEHQIRGVTHKSLLQVCINVIFTSNNNRHVCASKVFVLSLKSS